jgi:competence protein ComEC
MSRFSSQRLAPPAPLVPVAIGLIGGILLDHQVPVRLIYAVVVVVIAAAILLLGRRHASLRAFAIALAAGALGAVLHDNAARRVPANHIARYTADEPVLMTVTGTLADDPVVREVNAGYFSRWMPGRMRTRLLLEADQLEGVNGPIAVTGLVQINVHQPLLDLSIGDRVRAIGRLYRPSPPANPGQFDWSAFLRRQGVLAAMSCKYAAAVRRVDGSRTGNTPLHRLRIRLTRLLRDQTYGDEDTASLLEALVLGQRGEVPQAMNQAFVRTGTVHFLSVSGTHVGVLALFVWWLAGSLGLGRPAASVVALVTILAYVVVAEPCVPILRTGIVYGLACIAVGLRRPTSALNWLAAAVIILLAWRPCDLFAADFQLSFGIVLALFVLCPVVLRWFQHLRLWWSGIPAELAEELSQWTRWRRWRERFVTGFLVLLSTSLTAWLVGSGITLWQFQRMSPWGWFNSLVIWPLVTFLVICGFFKVILSAVWPVAGIICGAPLGWVTALLTKSVTWLDKLPLGQLEFRQPPWWCVTAYFSWLAAVIVFEKLHIRRRWAAISATIPTACIAASVLGSFAHRDELRMWALSVGDGQAILMQLPAGKGLLCDLGTRSNLDAGEGVAVPAFLKLGVSGRPAAVVSHANIDHFSGLLNIDDHFGLGQVFLSRQFADQAKPGGPARFLLDELARRKVTVRQIRAGDRIDTGGPVAVDVLWPPETLSSRTPENDCSIVLRVRHADRSVLICGDIGAEPQRQLMRGGNVKSDVLVLPHHGGVVKTTAEFIAAVNPSIVIRSGGRRAGVNHLPVEAIVQNRQYFDTSRDGAIEVTIRPDGLSARAPYRRSVLTASESEQDDNE